jgi:hypothetical protein
LIEPPSVPDKAEADAAERERLEATYAAGRVDEDTLTSLGITPLTRYTGERQLPWPLDILLYPTSPSGLIAIAVIASVPLFLGLLARLVPFSGAHLGLLPFLVTLFVGVYAAWYWAECTYDSAIGGTRAPKVSTGPMNWRDMFSRVIYLFAVCAVYILPVVLYHRFSGRTDGIFWGLLAWAIVLSPMGLLAMVIYDSSSALNPLLLLDAIRRTLFSYAGLLAFFALLGSALWLTFEGTDEEVSLWHDLLVTVIAIYGSFVLAHILGRFYWRCREKIDWGV